MPNIVLCRGNSTGFWSKSRTMMSKLFNNQALLQLTVDRNTVFGIILICLESLS